MHIAKFFDGYVHQGEYSFTEEIWVKRNKPLVIGKEIDKTFYDQPVFVRYNVEKKKFQYFQGKGIPKMKGTFTEIEEKYIQDRAWEYYPFSKKASSRIKAVSKLKLKEESSSNQERILVLDPDNILRYQKAKKTTYCMKMPKGIRV